MTTREYVYFHIWPIEDEEASLFSLKAHAASELSAALGRLGVRPTRRPRIDVYDDRLVASVPVLRLDGDEPVEVGEESEVLRLLAEGHPVGHIAAELGVPRSWVEQIRDHVEAEQPPPVEAEVAE